MIAKNKIYVNFVQYYMFLSAQLFIELGNKEIHYHYNFLPAE